MVWEVPTHVTRNGQQPEQIPDDFSITYGTAGFRGKASTLHFVMHRMGALAAIISRHRGGRAMGVMVTASHNPACDNGVKIVEPNGDMLESVWEPIATKVANASDAELVPLLRSIQDAHPPPSGATVETKGIVLIGEDTRSSSSLFSSAVETGATLTAGADAKSFGICTTPQLHFLVRCWNYPNYAAYPESDCTKPSSLTLDTYTNKFVGSFVSVNQGLSRCEKRPLNVDCANGVGAMALTSLVNNEAFKQSGLLDVHTHNGDVLGLFDPKGRGEIDERLNNKCGADFVKQSRCAPKIYAKCSHRFENESAQNVVSECKENHAERRPAPGERWATFDGDADRLMYFYVDEAKGFRLLDGDKMAVLLTLAVKKLAADAGVTITSGAAVAPTTNGDGGDVMQLGVVQTGYANGASTKYIREKLGVQVDLVPTGVKHLHKVAKKYDVGVYFEANGHGTILFSDRLKLRLTEAGNTARKFTAFISLVNETVGDAVADLLCIESALALVQWTDQQWDAIYEDLPSVMTKVVVPDRSIIKTTWDETRCIQPQELQIDIDELVKDVAGARAFVRPSGTEDIVRVYAEAESLVISGFLALATFLVVMVERPSTGAQVDQVDAKQLAERIGDSIKKRCAV